jgi:predicted Zn-dependent peptidase
LTNLLGGPAMNSKLNLNIREKHGLVYQIQATYTSFEDSGYATIYFSADEKKRERVIKLVQDELRQFCQKGISQDSLDKAIRQFTGNVLLQHDNRQNLLHFYLKELFHPVVTDTEGYLKKIRAVTPEQIQTSALKYLQPDKLSVIQYLPES